MSFLDRWRTRRQPVRSHGQQGPPSGQPQPPDATQHGFVVIDTETTGLSPYDHRILELAVVRADAWGRVTHEWVYRFNPEGPVGATHIHGIRDAEIAGAPPFRDAVSDISRRLAGGAVVGHNVRFDLAFLRAEYARAGWALPWLPSLCTLEASHTYLPGLDRRRLPDCCWAAGVPVHTAHSALHDARAAAALLARFLEPRFGPPLHDHVALCEAARTVAWPVVGDAGRQAPAPDRVRRTFASPSPRAPRLIEVIDRFRLDDALDEGAPTGSLPYLELLAEVIEDGELTADEAAALDDLAQLYELGVDDRHAAARGFLLALAHVAADDGKISRAERDELYAVAELLRLDAKLVLAVLDHADAARDARLSEGLKALPPDWHLGEPLRVGQKVAFTGCDDAVRERLEHRATRLGLRVMNNVSRHTALLVTDGSYTGDKARAAAELGTRVVTPQAFETMLTYLQPALPRNCRPMPQARVTAPAAVPPQTSVGPDPAIVRQWARGKGLAVGVRGRIPAEVLAAYEAAVISA